MVSNGHGNRNGGSVVFVAAQVHAEITIGVIVDDDSGSAQLHSGVCLVGKVGHTTGAEDDLALQIHAGIFCFVTDAVNEDILIGSTGAVGRSIDGGQGLVAVIRILHVHNIEACYAENDSHDAIVIHGSNGEEIVVGSGGTDGVEDNVIGVGSAEHGHVGPLAFVTCGTDDHGIGLGHEVQQLGIVVIEGMTGHQGTQGQVDGVTAQQDGVLNGCHIVGVTQCSIAEDLHGDQLCIGCNT